MYIYPLFFGFPSHLGPHRALSRVPCAIYIHKVLISYPVLYSINTIMHSINSMCVCVCVCIYIYISLNPGVPIYPSHIPALVSICLCLYFCFADMIVNTIFLDSTYMR